MAHKPYSIIILVLFFLSSHAFNKHHVTSDPLNWITPANKESSTSFKAGDPITPSSLLADEDISFETRLPLPANRKDQINKSFAEQIADVHVLTQNSVVTIAPIHPADITFEPLPPSSLETASFASSVATLKSQAKALYDQVKAAQKNVVKTPLPFAERLCAGPDIQWDKGPMGMASFVVRGNAAFWDGALAVAKTTTKAGTFQETPARAPTSYNAYKYWLVKGPHKEGDRFNIAQNPLVSYGPESKIRLENISRTANLTVTDVKSPFAKIFEGTESPVKDKYTVVNLAAAGTGVGSVKDDWYCLTAAGGLLDTSYETEGTKYVLKGRSVVLKNTNRALAMPLYHRDIDSDFGVGLILKDDPAFSFRNPGPKQWMMDLGYDNPISAGGAIEQGGLIKGYPVQKLPIYIWGDGERGYIQPNQPPLCIDTHNGKGRSFLWVPEGSCRVSKLKGAPGNSQFFEWPGDGNDGTGRVSIDAYKGSIFPAAFYGYDQGLSLWNGKRIFRFKGFRGKGGSRWKNDLDYGVYSIKPYGGINYPEELPWVMPKVKGMPDGKFDTTADIASVSEVSARVGDAALAPFTNIPRGITKWKFAEIYPYSVLARCAGRGDAEAAKKLQQFYGHVIPPKETAPQKLISKDSSDVRYGSMAKLQHKESGQYLTISKFPLPSDPSASYVTCTPDINEAGWWMVAPGKDLASREGGVALEGGEGIRLVEKNSKKVLCAVDALPPLSLNYVVPKDSEISPAILGKYNMPVAAFSGATPPALASKDPANWIVGPAFPAKLTNESDAAYKARFELPATQDALKTAGIQLKNHLFDGFLSSVNGYRFKPTGSADDWIQEVTVYDSGFSDAALNAGDFGTWMLADIVPAPSTRQEMINAGFEGPLTSFDGKAFTLTQVAMGTDGCVYGVDGSQNAVKIDLIKKTQEQIATGIKQIAVGADDSIIMLKVDGTIILRQSGGSDMVVPGCLGRSVAIGNASTFAAASADGVANGLLMINESNQLLGRNKRASSIDITDDGYVFGIQPKTQGSSLALWKKSSSLGWQETSLEALGESIARISAGSTRFMALHGNHGSLFVLNPSAGADIFSNPDVLLSTPKILSNPSNWQKITNSNNDIIVADAAISSNGDLVVLAGQINDNFEFSIFTKSYAPWPQESDILNLKVETSPATAGNNSSIPGKAATYSKILICDNEHGYLKESENFSGQSAGTQGQGAVSQFSMASLDGYVTLQAKSGQAMRNSNSGLKLAKDDKLQNKNMMTAKNNAGTAISAGTKFDSALIADQMAVGFGGEKFKSPKDADAILEKFMFYSEPSGIDGSLRFKLQSKATQGFLKLDPTTKTVVSLQEIKGVAVPITKADGSIFVISSVTSTDLKLQQSLVGKNTRDAMTVIETAFIDAKTYGNGVESFLENITHWLEGVRISPDIWTDFSQTKSEWINPVTKLKQSMTASERLSYLIAPASIQANPILKTIYDGLIIETDPSEKCVLLKKLREDAVTSNAPMNLGLIKNVKDGSVIALRSKYGIASDGKLTTNKSDFVSELYVAVDPARNVVTLSRTTAIDPEVQFHMKVVPSPLAKAQNTDSGHDVSDIQRWMMQASDATDAAVKRICAPTLMGKTIDSEEIALNAVALRYQSVADTAPATLLSAYFDVDIVSTQNTQTQITLKSASDSGYWALGISATDPSVRTKTLVKTGLQVINPETDTLKDSGVLDLDIRTQEVLKAGDGTYSQKPVAGTPTETGYAPAVFEIVIITPTLEQLTAAFKKSTLDEKATDFLAVAKQLEKTIDVVTFCQAISSFVKNNIRNSQTNWSDFVGNRSVRDKLAECLTSIKQLFADDYGRSPSNIRSFVDNLNKIIDITRVPSFGVTKSRADIITDLSAQIIKLQSGSELDKFVISGSSALFISNLQRAVNDWFTSVGISISDPKAQEDGDTLIRIIADYKNIIGVSLSKADSEVLKGLSLTLTNLTSQSNPVDILQGIVSANTINGVVSFGSDAKYSFMSKLWELYKGSTLDPEVEGPVVQNDKIISRGPVFGLSPAQLTQLSTVILSASKAPAGTTSPGGPFFADDARGELRSTKNNDGWGWQDQPFADLTNTQIINQLAILFAVPTFGEFTSTYLQYLSLSQESLSDLAISENPRDLAQVQRFALRIITLGEQWNSWTKASTMRLKRQELNQFKSLIRSVKSFIRSNPGLKIRTDNLLTTIQSALDQLA